MIPVLLAEEPETFDQHVRQRGERAVQRLLGQKVPGPGRGPKTTYATLEEIPTSTFPEYWTEIQKGSNRSALDDLMDAYEQRCAYLAMRIERATGSRSVDHYIAKEADRRLIYEWSNYRLCANVVNAKKGTKDVVDPFQVQTGWFELDLDTFFVRRGAGDPIGEYGRFERTLEILNLRECIALRGRFITDYRARDVSFNYLERDAPFIAAEIRRQAPAWYAPGIDR